MFKLNEFLKLCNYQITEGSQYLWSCYGPDAYCLDSWIGGNNGYTLSVVFDKKTQFVYELQLNHFGDQIAYRWIAPEYEKAFRTESTAKEVNADLAWDSVLYTNFAFASAWKEATKLLIKKQKCL